jgi:hypothetical protein
MNTYHFKPGHLPLALAVAVSVFAVGCATQPSSKAGLSAQRFDIEGTWSWVQEPWEGTLVLKKEGDSYAGTLDDTFEGTFGDKIADVEISGDHLKFTRYGRYGIQHWEGTLKEDNGVLKIADGQWSKEPSISGTFYAEKKQ